MLLLAVFVYQSRSGWQVVLASKFYTFYASDRVKPEQSYNKNNRITKTVMKQTLQGNRCLSFFFSFTLKVLPWLETKSLMTVLQNFEIQRTTATFSSRGFAKYNNSLVSIPL